MSKKTNAELVESIRGCGQSIDTCWYEAFPLGREVDLDGLRKIESYSNALHIYCKLLRQRLEAQTTLTEGGTWPNSTPIHVTLKPSDVTRREGE